MKQVHRLDGISYTIKDHTLIKKLVAQFPEQAGTMACYWIKHNSLQNACNLGLFYAKRYEVYEEMFKHLDGEQKDYGWD